MKLIRSRRLALAAGTVATVLALSACSSGGSGSSAAPSGAAASAGDAQKPASITFLTFQSPNLTAQYWQKQVKAVQKTYPHLKVKIEYTPGLDRESYAKQLLASGQLPDVIWDSPLSDFVKAKALLPYSNSDLTKIAAPASAGAIDGKHYSLTNGLQVIPLVYYNKTMFSQLGIAVPKTWDEMMAAAAKIKAAGKTPFLAGGSTDAWTSTMLLDGIIDTDVYAKNNKWMAERKAGKVHFTDPDMKAAVTKWQKVITSGYLNPDALSLSYDQLGAKFAAGGGAMYPMGSWAGTTKPQGFDVGVFPLPSDDGTVVLSQNFGQALTVSAKTKYPDQARAFAVAIGTGTSAATASLNSDSLIPTVKGYQVPPATAPLIKDTVAAYRTPGAKYVLPFGWAQGADASPTGFDQAFNQAAQKVISGGSVDDFLKTADQQFDDLNQ